MKRGKVLLVGQYIPNDLTKLLLKDGWEVKCIHSPDPRHVQKAFTEFSPKAIVFIIPASNIEERAHQRILDETREHRVPTFIAGPLTWEKCSAQKGDHIDFASKFTHQDIVNWVHSTLR